MIIRYGFCNNKFLQLDPPKGADIRHMCIMAVLQLRSMGFDIDEEDTMLYTVEGVPIRMMERACAHDSVVLRTLKRGYLAAVFGDGTKPMAKLVLRLDPLLSMQRGVAEVLGVSHTGINVRVDDNELHKGRTKLQDVLPESVLIVQQRRDIVVEYKGRYMKFKVADHWPVSTRLQKIAAAFGVDDRKVSLQGVESTALVSSLDPANVLVLVVNDDM